MLQLAREHVVQGKTRCGIRRLSKNGCGETRPERGDAFHVSVSSSSHQPLDLPSRTAKVCIAFSIGCFDARTCMQLPAVNQGSFPTARPKAPTILSDQEDVLLDVSRFLLATWKLNLLKQAAIEAEAPLSMIQHVFQQIEISHSPQPERLLSFRHLQITCMIFRQLHSIFKGFRDRSGYLPHLIAHLKHQLHVHSGHKSITASTRAVTQAVNEIST